MLDPSGNRSAAPPPPADGGVDLGAPAMMARARWLMVISALTTAVAIAAVLGVIGYRIFHAGRSVTAPGRPGAIAAGLITLPKGARVVSTGTAGDRIVVTIEVAGSTEIRTFDANTLQETGRLRFVTEP
jgi:hypothetical protein